MKLFMIGMGGNVSPANIEVHDMRFAISNTKEEAFDIVKGQWYGNTLHIDSFIEINELNGYKVDLNSNLDNELFMIVYGGYKEGHIDELHDYHFVIAEDKEKAKVIGKSDMSNYDDMDHIDNIVNVFDVLGKRFGLVEGNYKFQNNTINHTYIKIIKEVNI